MNGEHLPPGKYEVTEEGLTLHADAIPPGASGDAVEALGGADARSVRGAPGVAVPASARPAKWDDQVGRPAPRALPASLQVSGTWRSLPGSSRRTTPRWRACSRVAACSVRRCG